MIDKGTTDAILCGTNSFHNVFQMNKHIARMMKKGVVRLDGMFLELLAKRKTQILSGSLTVLFFIFRVAFFQLLSQV